MAMRKYQPCDRDREIVQHMSAIPGVTREQIAFCITNDRTGKAINRRTLEKHFGKELELGMATMQKIVMKSFVEQIQNHVWPATRLGLANYCGLKDGGDVVVGAAEHNMQINVIGVASPHSGQPTPGPIDLKVNTPAQLPPPVDIPVAPHRAEPEIVEAPRTEFDLTDGERNALGLPNSVPWQKRKSRDRPYRGPLQWGGKKRTGWLG
jgi:hypothetical protein